MTFIRLKKIAGKRYACLVENTWTVKGPRQQVKQYLGKYIPLAEAEMDASQPDIMSLVSAELKPRGFSDTLTKDGVKINLRLCTIRDGRKKAVLGLNGGYLCDYTLRRLVRFQAITETTPGYALARAFSDAGIRVPRDQFVAIYKKVYKSKVTV